MNKTQTIDIDNRIKDELMSEQTPESDFSPTSRLSDAFKAVETYIGQEDVRIIVDYHPEYTEVSFKNKMGQNLGFYGSKPTLESAICEALIQALDERLEE